MHLNIQSDTGKSVFWDTFVFNEKANKVLHKVIAKYVQMGYNFHFYDSKNTPWEQKYQKYDGCHKWESESVCCV